MAIYGPYIILLNNSTFRYGTVKSRVAKSVKRYTILKFSPKIYTRYLIQKLKIGQLKQKKIAQKTQITVPKGNFCQPIT